MSKKERILKAIRNLARKMFPSGEGKVFLYGSRAIGESRVDSDWDLLVITDDKISGTDDYRDYAFPYAELGWRFGEQITPVHYTHSEWEAESRTAFYQNIQSSLIPL